MNADDFTRELLAVQSYPAAVERVAAFFAGCELFFGHGTETPEDEAHWLVAALLDWDDDRWAAAPARERLEKIAAIATERVSQRRPLAYLLGEAWFAGLRFEVDDSVLVPRSPFAEIIEAGFAPWAQPADGDRVLEIGTGSGCIAIATACYLPGVRVDATDVSADALALARRNAGRHGVTDRVSLLEADLFPPGEQRYGVIMSNPPYVPSGRLDALPPEYRHEPALGLVSGADGLDAVRRILAGASERLDEGGVLIVEVGESDLAVEAAFPALPLTWLEFEYGGSGVFVVTRADLIAAGF